MRTIKLLLVLAPFALAAACGGKKPEMAEPAVPTTPDMSLDAGGLPSIDSGSTDMTTPTTPTTPSTDTTTTTPDAGSTVAATTPVDAGPADAGKGKGGKPKGGGKPKK
jgi:hypothetical protein